MNYPHHLIRAILILSTTFLILIGHRCAVNALSLASGNLPSIIKHPEENLSSPKTVKDVCIVGGGPVGLATAIMLSRPPHNYNCEVLESNSKVNDFYPGRGFLYNVNTRGRKFTQLFPSLDEQLQISGVKSDFKRFCIVPSDPDEALPDIAIQASKEGDNDDKVGISESISGMVVPKGESLNSGIKTIMDSQKEKGGTMRDSYWIQRHDFTKLLRDYCLEGLNDSNDDTMGSVEIISGSKCVDVYPCNEGDSENGGIEVIVKDTESKKLSNFSCNLVVGADGYRSKVSTKELLLKLENLKWNQFNHPYAIIG